MRRMAPAPRVAVVIVNLNGGKLIRRTLDALALQSLAPARVIVVDNASTDGSTESLDRSYESVELIRLEQNAGFAGGNNVGIRAADDCDWIVLLNPDAFPEPPWLETMLRTAERHPEYSFFGSSLVLADDPTRLDGTGDVYHVGGLAFRRDHGRPVAKVKRESGEIFSPCAAAALYRRDALLEVGGFDESYFCYLEDLDLAFRLRFRGHRCLYVPEAVCLHMGSALTGRTSDFTIYHSHRNLVWTFVKNMPRPLLWLYLPQHLLVNVVAVLAYSVLGQGRAILSSKRDALRGLPRVLAERHALQRERKVGARDLRRLMGKGLEAYTTPIKRAWELWR
jgi:GT2 family glycosyltransferase